MKTCKGIQQALRDRFDLGEDLAEFGSVHIAVCEMCRAYRADLMRLADELAVFDLDFAPEDLSARVIQHVRERGIDHSLRIGDYAAIALIAAAASVTAGWYMPAWVEPAAWWSQASNWLTQADGMYSLSALMDRTVALRTVFDNAFSSVPMASQSVIWTALAVSCLGAVAFNGFMAVRMRTAGD